MTLEEIRASAPNGATAYAEVDDRIYYFFKSNYGYRQIKGNIIQFDDPNIDDYIKPLF